MRGIIAALAMTTLAAGCGPSYIEQLKSSQAAVPTPMITTDGTFRVGPDIPAGVWETHGTSGTGTCLWIRKADVGGAELQRGQVSVGESARVTLHAGESFTSMWCAAWSKV